MRLHRLLGERRLSWIRRRCHRQLRRSKFPRADHRGVGGVTPPLGLLAARHAAQTRGEARVIKQPLRRRLRTFRRTKLYEKDIRTTSHKLPACDVRKEVEQ